MFLSMKWQKKKKKKVMLWSQRPDSAAWRCYHPPLLYHLTDENQSQKNKCHRYNKLLFERTVIGITEMGTIKVKMYFNFFTYKILFKSKIYLLVSENSACLRIQTKWWGERVGQKRMRTQTMREKWEIEYGEIEGPSKMKKREETSASTLNAKFGKTKEKRETRGK